MLTAIMRLHNASVILEVKHLELVRATHTEGSLSRAARILNVTQSALSHQLKNLELQLGTELFTRAGNRLRITPAGHKLLDASAVVLHEIREAEAAIGSLSRGDAGTLRLATECHTCYHWLPPVLRTFRDLFPGVEIAIETAWTGDPIHALNRAEIDVAVVSRKVGSARMFELFEDEMVAVMSPEHPLARLKRLQPRHFSDVTLLGYQSLEESDAYRRILKPSGVRPRTWLRASLTEAILELAKSGIGVGVMAAWAIPERVVTEGSVVVRPIRSRGTRRTWYAAIRDGRKPRWIEEFALLLQRTLQR